MLGIGLAAGDGVSVGLLAAIFVSNLPEAIGSASAMRAAGTRPAAIRRLWVLIARRLHDRHARRLRASPTSPAATSRPPSTASPPAPCS